MDEPDIDDLELASEEDEFLEVMERRVLTRGPFPAVAFLVRTRKDADGEWTGPHLWLHRYQRRGAGFKLLSKFHTTGTEQLARLADALGTWMTRG